MKRQINVLLVDDQRLFSENLKLMLETITEDIRVMAVAENGQKAIEFLETAYPDIILMDVRMPVLDGVKATKIIIEKHPDVKIVMLTTFVDDIYVQEALKYGAYGYLLKNIKPDDLIASLYAIDRGAVLMSPDILRKLVKKLDLESDQKPDNEDNELINKLGNREREILKLISKGYNNKKIAEILFISEPTVRNYISSIYAKVGSNDRLEVISIAKKAYEN